MLKTWDAAGRQTLALDTRVAKFMGVATIGWNFTGGAQSGTIVDSRFTQYAGAEPFALAISGSIDVFGSTPSLTISGNTLTWQYRYAPAEQRYRPDTKFIYGIF